MSEDFLNRCIQRAKEMTNEEVLAHHEEAQRTMKEPVFVPVENRRLKEQLESCQKNDAEKLTE